MTTQNTNFDTVIPFILLGFINGYLLRYLPLMHYFIALLAGGYFERKYETYTQFTKNVQNSSLNLYTTSKEQLKSYCENKLNRLQEYSTSVKQYLCNKGEQFGYPCDTNNTVNNTTNNVNLDNKYTQEDHDKHEESDNREPDNHEQLDNRKESDNHEEGANQEESDNQEEQLDNRGESDNHEQLDNLEEPDNNEEGANQEEHLEDNINEYKNEQSIIFTNEDLSSVSKEVMDNVIRSVSENNTLRQRTTSTNNHF